MSEQKRTAVERLRTEGLGKWFGPVQALKKVSLDIRPGEVHALVGENGAGKSTFIKMITGVYSIDEGLLFWEGKQVDIRNPQDAAALGIRVIHQDRQLIPSFSGYENLYLGKTYPSNSLTGKVSWKKMKATGDALKQSLGIELDLSRLVQDMSPPERTMLEIMRAMMDECKLLILDEPTASLTDREAERLFAFIGRLIEQGTSILYVSHRMDEIFRLSDRITVMRNGEWIATIAKAEATKEMLVRLMTDASHGKAPSETVHHHRSLGDKVLSISNVQTADGRVKQANFTLHRGEIVGIFGLAGAGRTELLEAVYGLRSMKGGSIEVKGQRISPSPKQSINNGMVLIAEDRRSHSMIASMTIRENMTLPVLDGFAGWLRLNHRKERAAVQDKMELLQVRATGADQQMSQLSGGNQQKVVFAKALMSEPIVYLCDEPTQAVDVMTREEIHRLLRNKALDGCGIVFVSSDLQEVLEIADRIVIMHEGRTIAELDNEGVTPEQVLNICYRHDGKKA